MRPCRSRLDLHPYQITMQMETVSGSAKGSVILLAAQWVLGVGVVARVVIDEQFGPSALIAHVVVPLPLNPSGAHAVNSSRPQRDLFRNQARRDIPPGCVGYPSSPSFSNRCGKPFAPTNTFRSMRTAHAIGQMAEDRVRFGR